MALKSVLIVDNDLGFVFWLGQVLQNEGHQAWPAIGVPDAIELIRELEVPIDLVVMKPSMSGSADLMDCLRRSSSQVKILPPVIKKSTPSCIG